MKRIWLVLALTAVVLSSSTAWAEWIYPGARVRAFYAAPVVVVRPRPYAVWAAPAPVYYAPPVYAAPVYSPPVYAAPVYAPSMYSTAYASPSVYAATPIYSASGRRAGLCRAGRGPPPGLLSGRADPQHDQVRRAVRRSAVSDQRWDL